jgi:hypothetical protein
MKQGNQAREQRNLLNLASENLSVLEGDESNLCRVKIAVTGHMTTICMGIVVRDTDGGIIDGTCATQRHMANFKQPLKLGCMVIGHK